MPGFAHFTKMISYPARISLLESPAETTTCISSDFSDYFPLSIRAAFQPLNDLRDPLLIHRENKKMKIKYFLCSNELKRFTKLFNGFFEPIKTTENNYETNQKP